MEMKMKTEPPTAVSCVGIHLTRCC